VTPDTDLITLLEIQKRAQRLMEVLLLPDFVKDQGMDLEASDREAIVQQLNKINAQMEAESIIATADVVVKKYQAPGPRRKYLAELGFRRDPSKPMAGNTGEKYDCSHYSSTLLLHPNTISLPLLFLLTKPSFMAGLLMLSQKTVRQQRVQKEPEPLRRKPQLVMRTRKITRQRGMRRVLILRCLKRILKLKLNRSHP